MANELIITDFENYTFSCPKEEMLERFKQAAEQEKSLNNGETKHQELYAAALKQPDYMNKLYNIHEASKHDTPPTASVSIALDDEGNPYAKIRKKMEGGFFDFAICDGKVVFNGKMDDAKMAEALDFLFRRGITNFDLPQGVDADFAETYKENLKKLQNYNIPHHEVDCNLVERTPLDKDKVATKKWKNPAKGEKKGFDKAVSEMETWLGSGNQKKKENLSYFKRLKWFSDDVEFSVYNSEDKNNYKNDGKKDKNGVVKETCAYRLRLIPNKEGKLGAVKFHIPNDGKIPDALADQLASLAKSQGHTFINFPEGLSPTDAGVVRLACARAGIIPTGIGINENHAKKMISEAESSLSEEDFAKFKYNLALQMERNANLDGKNRTNKKIQELKNEYIFAPLKDNFDNVIAPEIQARTKENCAEKTIGSVGAAKELYDIFDRYHDISIGKIMASNVLDDQTKKLFKQKLNMDDNTPSPDTPFKELNHEQVRALFNALEVKHTKRAREDLIAATADSHSKRDINDDVRKKVSDAREVLSEIVKDFDEKGHKGWRYPNLGNPNFEKPASQNQAPQRTTPSKSQTMPLQKQGGRV